MTTYLGNYFFLFEDGRLAQNVIADRRRLQRKPGMSPSATIVGALRDREQYPIVRHSCPSCLGAETSKIMTRYSLVLRIHRLEFPSSCPTVLYCTGVPLCLLQFLLASAWVSLPGLLPLERQLKPPDRDMAHIARVPVKAMATAGHTQWMELDPQAGAHMLCSTVPLTSCSHWPGRASLVSDYLSLISSGKSQYARNHQE
jgi:hypothetical protein